MFDVGSAFTGALIFTLASAVYFIGMLFLKIRKSHDDNSNGNKYKIIKSFIVIVFALLIFTIHSGISKYAADSLSEEIGYGFLFYLFILFNILIRIINYSVMFIIVWRLNFNRERAFSFENLFKYSILLLIIFIFGLIYGLPGTLYRVFAVI